MKKNHDGTITLNAYDSWIACGACGKRVTADSMHTCSPQLKELTDAEIIKLFENDELWTRSSIVYQDDAIDFARAILRKAQEK